MIDAQLTTDSLDLGEVVLGEDGIGPNPGLSDMITYYFHSDHLGSSTAITDGSGYLYQIFLNLPFGETMAEQRRSGTFSTAYKFNGKELDSETGLYYYGARYYNPRISNWLSVDPLTEQTMTPYQYTYQNPVRYIDPTGMAPEDLEVTKLKDGTYRVVGGSANADKNIYVVQNGKKTGEVIGKMLTNYSFHSENGNAIKDAIIDPSDTSGINFLNTEIINDKKLTLQHYILNAGNNGTLDFKTRGVDRQLDDNQRKPLLYRGMLFQNVDDIDRGSITTFASARDIGNIAAGYVAGSRGFNWMETRIAFDTYQSYKSERLSIEGLPSQLAQKIGHSAGKNAFWQKFYTPKDKTIPILHKR